MSKIVLPPLPFDLRHPDECVLISAGELHARDIKVARVVLEAAAKCAEKQDYRHTSARPEIAADIRALKVGHE